MKPLIHTPALRLARHRGPGRHRARAALLTSIMALSCALPVSVAVAQDQPAGSGSLTVLNAGGTATELTSKVTLAQLASLLNITPTELIGQIEALPGNSVISLLLHGLATDPTATLQSVLDGLTANGLNPGLVEQLVDSLLAPTLTSSGQLQGVVATLLSDLGVDGQLESLASQLNVPLADLERVGLLPVSDESVAGTLDTTVDHLSSLLGSAGAIVQPLGPLTPLVSTPLIASGGGTTEVVGVPGAGGGVSLTTISSTTPGQAGQPGAAGANAAASPAGIRIAFSIVSVKLTKAGTILETVKVPSAGRLTVKASAKANVASASRSGHAKISKKTIKINPLAANVAQGTRTITLHPGRAIRNASHIAVALTTSYTPKGGAASTKHSAVTFKGMSRHGRR